MFSNIATCQVINISRWRSWLRRFATTRKVVGSITDYVTVILPSGRAVALGSTHLLKAISTGDVSWVVKAAGE